MISYRNEESIVVTNCFELSTSFFCVFFRRVCKQRRQALKNGPTGSDERSGGGQRSNTSSTEYTMRGSLKTECARKPAKMRCRSGVTKAWKQ